MNKKAVIAGAAAPALLTTGILVSSYKYSEPEASFETDENGDTVSISKYTGTNAVVNIPKTINGKTVIEIGNNAFADNTTITKVTMPNTVTDIDVGAFSGTANLEEIKLSKNLTDLLGQAFKNSGLKTITIPVGVETLTDGCFAGNTKLETVSLPGGMTEIGDHVFADCTVLESIIIPNSVTLINETAFDNCDLAKLTIKGKAGSEAETYANSNGIKFEVIS